MSGDIWGCHTRAGVRQVEARDAVQHPTRHRTAPTPKTHRTPSVIPASVETGWRRMQHCWRSSWLTG